MGPSKNSIQRQEVYKPFVQGSAGRSHPRELGTSKRAVFEDKTHEFGLLKKAVKACLIPAERAAQHANDADMPSSRRQKSGCGWQAFLVSAAGRLRSGYHYMYNRLPFAFPVSLYNP